MVILHKLLPCPLSPSSCFFCGYPGRCLCSPRWGSPGRCHSRESWRPCPPPVVLSPPYPGALMKRPLICSGSQDLTQRPLCWLSNKGPSVTPGDLVSHKLHHDLGAQVSLGLKGPQQWLLHQDSFKFLPSLHQTKVVPQALGSELRSVMACLEGLPSEVSGDAGQGGDPNDKPRFVDRVLSAQAVRVRPQQPGTGKTMEPATQSTCPLREGQMDDRHQAPPTWCSQHSRVAWLCSAWERASKKQKQVSLREVHLRFRRADIFTACPHIWALERTHSADERRQSLCWILSTKPAPEHPQAPGASPVPIRTFDLRAHVFHLLY